MSQEMNVVVKHVAKTTAQWGEVLSVIPNRVLCVEVAANNKIKIKIGDGVRTWSALPYVSSEEVDLSGYYTKTEVDSLLGNVNAQGIEIEDVTNDTTYNARLQLANGKPRIVYEEV